VILKKASGEIGGENDESLQVLLFAGFLSAGSDHRLCIIKVKRLRGIS
jgi:hypothetical protein